MNRVFTVYFDTSFFVQLARADESLAEKTIRSLNNLGVRHVLSGWLLFELLTSADRPEKDTALVSRVSQFAIPPYCPTNELYWETLLLSGQERIDIANQLQEIDTMMTKANSWSILAERKLGPERESEVSELAARNFRPHGYPDNPEENPAEAILAVKSFFEKSGLDWVWAGVDWPDEITPETLKEFSEKLKGKLDAQSLKNSEIDSNLKSSATAFDDRPFQVVTNRATSKVKGTLANSYRDSNHMGLFVQHQDEIDLLQVDAAQDKQIKRPKPLHFLAAEGLAERCFSASNLDEVVAKITAFKKSCD